MANNKPFIVKSGLIPQTDNDQDLGGANNKFANAHISNLSGAVSINSAFTLPTADGSTGNVLQTDGAGNITWADLAAVTFSDTAPGSPQTGDLWFDSGTTAELFIWTGTEWISATGGDQAAFTIREFTGDASTVAFDTSVGTNVRAFVYLNGILLQETNDYSFANGIVTFVTAPGNGDLVQVLLHGLANFIDLSTIGGNTDDITEGPTNLFYTDARVQTKLGTVSGHILPDTDITYDLGSATNRFRDLYLSGNSIDLGGALITSDGIAVNLPQGTKLGTSDIPEVDLTIAPEVLEIQVDSPTAGQNIPWVWTWETSSLPYARRTITNSPESQVPLYKQGTYTINNYAAYDIHGTMTQTHQIFFKWIEGAGTDNLVSWAIDNPGNPISDSHPDINDGNATNVQRISVNVPANIVLPTLTPPNVSYTVTNNGVGAYTFSGNAEGDNPTIGPFYRGGTYTFNISATGHPFYLTTDNGTSFVAGGFVGEYTNGVIGSRSENGTLTITVPADAPDTLYYQCGNHASMIGVITVKDLAVRVNNNGNYIIFAQHSQDGMATPIEIRPIPSLVNQMCLVYDASVNKFVPQDLATYVENTPSFENKIREVAGTAELVVEDGSAVVAKVNVYYDSTYLPLVDNNPGDQAFATDNNTLYIWDGSAWQQAGGVTSVNNKIGDVSITNADESFWTYVSHRDDLPPATMNNHGMIMHIHEDGRIAFVHGGVWTDVANKSEVDAVVSDVSTLQLFNQNISTDSIPEGPGNLYYTDARVDARVNLVVDGAPGALDTLNELAAALNDDANFATTVNNSISLKANNATTITAGSGLTGGGDLSANRTISHADTSTLLGAQNASSGSVLQGVTVDDFGHITAIQTIDLIARASKLETARTITLSGEVSGSASFDGSGNINIVVDVLGGASDTSATADNANTLDGLDSTYFLNASNLDAGTVNDARLPSNIARTDTDQTISANHNFTSSSMTFSSHYYSNLYDGTNVYQHAYPAAGNGATPTNWNLRVWNGTSADALTVSGEGYLVWAGTSIRSASTTPEGQAVFSTDAYGSGQGDNRTHFGYLSGTDRINYIRGTLSYIDTPLTVNQTTTSEFIGRINNTTGDGDNNQPFRFSADYSGWAQIFAPNWTGGTGWGTFWAGNDGAAYKYFSNTNPNEYVFVGSGVTRASIDLNNGNAYFAGEVLAASDERLKSEINPITGALDIVLALEGKTYIKDDRQQIGLIAQQVETVLPEVVTTAGDEMGIKSVNYGNIVAVLVEAIKEQQKQINELKERLDGNI